MWLAVFLQAAYRYRPYATRTMPLSLHVCITRNPNLIPSVSLNTMIPFVRGKEELKNNAPLAGNNGVMERGAASKSFGASHQNTSSTDISPSVADVIAITSLHIKEREPPD
jgi:hypothetical protein